jgi:hypothetical protein
MRRSVPLIAISILLLGLSAGIYKVHFPPGPIGDEPAYVMMAESLWHDHDLAYDHRDLLRGYRLWDQGPNGVILFTADGGKSMFYGKPYIYALASLPFYGLFGVQGLIVFNMALFLAMLWGALWWWRDQSGHVALFLGGFFFASASFAYVFWMQPEVFNMACLFFAVLIWLHVRRFSEWTLRHGLLLALAGVLIACAYISKEPTVLLGGPIALDLLWQRRFKGFLFFVAPALLGLAFLFLLQRHETGQWSPYRGVQRRSFESEYPIESKKDLWQLYRGTTFGSWSGLGIETTPRIFIKDLWYFVVGRHTGLLPYFPFALFVFALYLLGPRDRARHLLALSIVGYCLVILVLRPSNYHGGAGFVGNRYFASLYPVLALLPLGFSARKSLLFPFAAAGLWTAPVVAVPLLQVAPEATLQAHVRTPSFQALPLELTLLQKIPGYWLKGWGDGVWVVPRHNFFAQEPNIEGVWVRGASRSEVVVATLEPISSIRLRVRSLAEDNVATFESGVDRVTVRFDSQGKRDGTPVEFKVEPVARNLAFLRDAKREYFYRFTLDVADGLMPARREENNEDYRYLGVFLEFPPQ